MGKTVIKVGLEAFMQRNPPKHPSRCVVCDLPRELVDLIQQAQAAGYKSVGISSLLAANDVQIGEGRIDRHLKGRCGKASC